jgi:hypothetical protein
LVGIIDDYFDGYFSEEMIESQVLLSLQSLHMPVLETPSSIISYAKLMFGIHSGGSACFRGASQ